MPLGLQNNVTEKSTIQVYPNPAESTVFIKFLNFEEEKINIGIYDLFGKVVLEVSNNIFAKGEQVITTSIEGLMSGLYFIRLQNNKEIITQKLEIIH